MSPIVERAISGIGVEIAKHAGCVEACVEDSREFRTIRSQWHIPCTVHSNFPVFATVFFGGELDSAESYGIGVERFEPNRQNADDNDCDVLSRHKAWGGFDKLTWSDGSSGKSYKWGFTASELPSRAG
jgi:hypothetical protein